MFFYIYIDSIHVMFCSIRLNHIGRIRFIFSNGWIVICSISSLEILNQNIYENKLQRYLALKEPENIAIHLVNRLAKIDFEWIPCGSFWLRWCIWSDWGRSHGIGCWWCRSCSGCRGWGITSWNMNNYIYRTDQSWEPKLVHGKWIQYFDCLLRSSNWVFIRMPFQ